jgi:hypothetical protein
MRKAILMSIFILTLVSCPTSGDDENYSDQKPELPDSPELVMKTATNPLIKGDVPDVSVLRQEMLIIW